MRLSGSATVSPPATASHVPSTVPFVADADLEVWLGDAVESLRLVPDASAQMCVTSPPFYGLRDYGVDGQIGLEASLEQWVAALVAVFVEVRRVLHPTGTLWLELADSHVSSRSEHAGLKPKDLLGAPFEAAMALRADGWWWRQTIIWHKRNAMPESAPDRPTTAHSYLFLMSPSRRYYYDDDAIAEPAEWARWGSQDAGKYETVGKGSLVQPLTREQIGRKFGGGRQRGAGRGGYKTTDERNERFQGSVELSPDDDQAPLFDYQGGEPGERLRQSWHDHADLEQGNGGPYRRSRSVWSLASEPNRLAVCSVCETFWDGDHPDDHCGQQVVEHYAAFPRELARRAIAAGSRTGDVVLDPFGGSGTTAIVARELGRKAVLVELRREYAVMIRERTKQGSLLGG